MKFSKILAIITAMMLTFCGCEIFPNAPKQLNGDAVASVKFFDVGQGDSELITLPDGKDILIDGGDVQYSKKILNFLEKNENDGKIDYIIATHPHSDHIGGLDDVLKKYEVGNFIMPKVANKDTPTTKAFENLLDAIEVSGCKASYSKAGEEILSGDGYSVKCLAPVKEKYKGLNNYSVIIKVNIKNVSLIFTGDAEYEAESAVMDTDADLKADVLKVGHHGSSTASTDKFLDEVDPKYAVISCGEGNRYGHPHKETINKLDYRGIQYYRTDLNGTVTLTTDGEKINMTSERE